MSKRQALKLNVPLPSTAGEHCQRFHEAPISFEFSILNPIYNRALKKVFNCVLISLSLITF